MQYIPSEPTLKCASSGGEEVKRVKVNSGTRDQHRAQGVTRQCHRFHEDLLTTIKTTIGTLPEDRMQTRQ